MAADDHTFSPTTFSRLVVHRTRAKIDGRSREEDRLFSRGRDPAIFRTFLKIDENVTHIR